MELPLKNKKGEITAKTLVSDEDYDHLSQIKWSMTNNYVGTSIEGKKWTLHRYIMIVILGNELTTKQPVDHINGNPLDNTRDNLRISTYSENNRNKAKRKNASSNYYGVVYMKDRNKWQANIALQNVKLHAIYSKEIHAAYQYNLWIDEFNLTSGNKNDIEKPEDFIIYKPREKKGNLPKGIEKIKNKYQVLIYTNKVKQNLGYFDNLDDAILIRNKAEIERTEFLKQQLLSVPILYNKSGQCVFKIKETEVIIDSDMYHDIIKYRWHIRKDGYLQSGINRELILLHKYVMNYHEGEMVVDHINRNPLDNRKCNLRIITRAQNMMNKNSQSGSSSKYIGVYFNNNRNKWIAQISYNQKNIQLRRFDNEIDAAKARDVGTKEYFGEFGNLNFP